MGRACSAYGRGERFLQGLVGKREGKRLMGRLRRRWEKNIKAESSESGMWGYGLY
jgi:hypothetical protein